METLSPQATRIPLKTRSYPGPRTTPDGVCLVQSAPGPCSVSQVGQVNVHAKLFSNSLQISHIFCIFLVSFISCFRFHIYIIIMAVINGIFTSCIIFIVNAFTSLSGYSASTSFSTSLAFFTSGSAPASSVTLASTSSCRYFSWFIGFLMKKCTLFFSITPFIIPISASTI